MRALVQRVNAAALRIDGAPGPSFTGPGLVILLGVAAGDGTGDAAWLAGKIAKIRWFDGPSGLMERTLADAGGACLVVSQFTLFASTQKGARPSFHRAAPPAQALPLYGNFLEQLRALVPGPVHAGRFGADMDISLTNEGPVTLLLDSRARE